MVKSTLEEDGFAANADPANEAIDKIAIDKIPYSFVLIGDAKGHKIKKPLLCLFDSGSTSTWIKKTSIPPGCNGTTTTTVTGQTMAGTFTSSQALTCNNVTFPEFFRSCSFESFTTRIFFSECRYDVIFGRDMISKMGLVLDFKDQYMEWDGQNVAIRAFPDQPILSGPNQVPDPPIADQMFLDMLEEDLLDNDDAYIVSEPADKIHNWDQVPNLIPRSQIPGDTFSNTFANTPQDSGYQTSRKGKEIKESKYEPVDLSTIVENCKHLNQEQQAGLLAVLSQYETLFSGKLGKYNGPPVHLDLEENTVPHRTRAYDIPHSQKEIFKGELDRLVAIGVLEPCGRSEWISGSFIIPKKDGRVRWISDFRGLNKALKRKVWPMPLISELLAKRSGYQFMSKIDISMQYYTFELDEESKDICTIATSFGLYRYGRLPMGVSVAPDIAQEIMDKQFGYFDDVLCYFDDLGAFSDDWETHLILLDKILKKLEDCGFTVNPLKCEWGVAETDFLGHWMTPQGIKPWHPKIEAVLSMQPPKNIKQLRTFLGLVNYYRDMWPRRSHILAPLTELTGKKQFIWLEEHQQAFKQMKALVALDALLAYPDYSLPFDIETDASDYQLGGAIKQNGRAIAYYSRKLTPAQLNYTTIEKETLSVVEILIKFRPMLIGAKINVYTDRKNITHNVSKFTTQRVMHWRLLLEEFGPTFFYKKGEENIVADAFSRVPTTLPKRKLGRKHDASAATVKKTISPSGHPQWAETLASPSIPDPWKTQHADTSGTKGPSPREGAAATSAIAGQPTEDFPPEPDQLEVEMLLPTDNFICFWFNNHPELVACFISNQRSFSTSRRS